MSIVLGDGDRQKNDVESLRIADEFKERRLVDHNGCALAFFERLKHRRGGIHRFRQRCRDGLLHIRRRDKHALRREKPEHACGLARLEGDEHIGRGGTHERRGNMLAFVAHANMARHAPAALRHADCLGGTHMPAARLRSLGEYLRGKHGTLSANAGKHYVFHWTTLQ